MKGLKEAFAIPSLYQALLKFARTVRVCPNHFIVLI